MNRIVVAAVLGQVVGLLGWIDPLFFVLVVAGPLLTGGLAAARRVPLLLVVVLWFSAGTNMVWTDWLVNREDVVFHLVLSVFMPAVSAGGYGLVALLTRRRVESTA